MKTFKLFNSNYLQYLTEYFVFRIAGEPVPESNVPHSTTSAPPVHDVSPALPDPQPCLPQVPHEPQDLPPDADMDTIITRDRLQTLFDATPPISCRPN